MIVDTSAVMAVLFKEPGHEVLVEKLSANRAKKIGTPSLLEAHLVLSGRLGIRSTEVLDEFLDRFGLTSTPFGEEHWRVATEAALRFGKGRHPAALNFGDCMTYAIAKVADQPLLFVGNDFGQTDLRSA